VTLEPTPGATPWAVKVEDLSVTYRTAVEKKPTLKKTLIRLGRRERIIREIKAVRDVSFEIPHGTALGVVGVNGAGKSTLLRTMAGILPPSRGRVEVFGRVSTLLALGVGFKGELTGQENVVLGGLAAGLSREQVAAKYEDIAEFAELGDFMEMPMRTYSSGMFSRLAFSVAVHMDPDILLIDEALSAGDASFKTKAAAKMSELVTNSRTMFLVSHAMSSVRELCNDCIWLHKGKLMMRGEPNEVIQAYTKFLQVGEAEAVSLEDL